MDPQMKRIRFRMMFSPIWPVPGADDALPRETDPSLADGVRLCKNIASKGSQARDGERRQQHIP